MSEFKSCSVCQGQQAIIDSLKAQLNNMEACYIGVKKQADELQKTNISLEAGLRKNSKNKQKLLGKNIELQKRIDAALVCVDQAKDGFYGFSCDGGDTDNLAKHLEKALRGES